MSIVAAAGRRLPGGVIPAREDPNAEIDGEYWVGNKPLRLDGIDFPARSPLPTPLVHSLHNYESLLNQRRIRLVPHTSTEGPPTEE